MTPASAYIKNKNKKRIILGQPFLNISLKRPSGSSLPEFYRVNSDLIERNKKYFKNKIDICKKIFICKNKINS